MKKVIAAALMGGAVIGSLLGAGMASADPTPGPYNATMIDGAGVKQAGQTVPWNASECGPDCIRVGGSGGGVELRRQGAAWVGTDNGGHSWSLDNASLILTIASPDPARPIVIGLTR